MNTLLAYCSPALLERLAGNVGEGVAVLAAERIRHEIENLEPLQARVLRWRFGIGCEPLARCQIARRLKVTVRQVRALEECALVELGFALVGFGGESGEEAA